MTFDKAISIVKMYLSSRKDICQDKNEQLILKLKENKCNRNVNQMIYINVNHLYKECPAYGKQCNNCKKINHFGVMCKATDRSNRRVNSSEAMEAFTADEREIEENIRHEQVI